jgi:hypothetical protein
VNPEVNTQLALLLQEFSVLYFFIMNENNPDRAFSDLKSAVNSDHELKQAPPVYKYPKEQLKKAIEGVGKHFSDVSVHIQIEKASS